MLEEERATILVVDDDQASIDVMHEMLMDLNSMKMDFRFAHDGIGGLKILRSEPVDVVIADIMMPHMSGLEFLKQAGMEEKFQPCILVTALHRRDIAIMALRLGAFDFIEKPVSSERLKFTVGKAIKVSRAYRKLEQEMEDSVMNPKTASLQRAAREILKLKAIKCQSR